MKARILHVLSQRPGRTGSGVTLEAWVREARARGAYEQDVVVGVPASEADVRVGDLPADRIHPLRFETPSLPFSVPGMSDVMPYESTVFSSMGEADLRRYLEAWREHLAAVLERTRPDVVHAHHLWLVAALLKDVAPDVPLVVQSHATGLRQMELCPALAPQVREGCRRAERVLALTGGHAAQIAARLGIDPGRIRVVGAGYRDDLFGPGDGAARRAEDLLYVGKYSRAKGLPWLLDAFERLLRRRPDLRLHVVGDAAGTEGRDLLARTRTFGDRIRTHGHLDQAALADLMRRVGVLVLPSLYEGLPLVLVEAVAAGCRTVATALPGIEEELAPRLGGWNLRVPPPRRRGVDAPVPEDLPAFVQALEAALEDAVDAAGTPASPPDLEAFTWGAAFARVEAAWGEARRRPEVAEQPEDR